MSRRFSRPSSAFGARITGRTAWLRVSVEEASGGQEYTVCSWSISFLSSSSRIIDTGRWSMEPNPNMIGIEYVSGDTFDSSEETSVAFAVGCQP